MTADFGRTGFDPSQDRLVCLRDGCDGGLRWIGCWPYCWTSLARGVPVEHRELLEAARPCLIEQRPGGRRVLYTHAGWRRGTPPEEQDDYHLRRGRDLWIEARLRKARAGDGDPPRLTDLDAVFLGHTPTEWTEPRPVTDPWNLDEGAGWDGVLTLMDLDTEEAWQSDPVPDLYPRERGRQ